MLGFLSEAHYISCKTETAFSDSIFMYYSDKSWPIPVAARSKAWVCGLSLAWIVGLNPLGGIDVCLL